MKFAGSWSQWGKGPYAGPPSGGTGVLGGEGHCDAGISASSGSPHCCIVI